MVLAPSAWGTGGIERATRTLLRALADLYGADCVGLLSLWGGEGPLPCQILWRGPPGTKATLLPLQAKLQFSLAALVAARRWKDRLVIVACHPNLALVARMCSSFSGAAYLVWCYGREVWEPLRPQVRWSLRSAGMVAVPSRFTYSMLRETSGVNDERLTVVPLTLSPEIPFLPPQRSLRRPNVISVARLVPEHSYKGVDTLVTAWPRVLHVLPEAELLVVGDGPDRKRLEHVASQLGLDERVHFCGRLEDAELARAYLEATLFALPVRTTVGRQAGGEGFGLVFLEAAAAGLPVVAGNGGAIPEVVRDGETGLLVNPESPTEVADAIIRLLLDPVLAQKMGEAARRRVQEEFSYELFRERVEALIDRVRHDS